MNIKQKLQTLTDYYNSTRGVGHTKTLLEGTNRVKSTIIHANQLQIDKDKGPNLKITLHNLDKLRGRKDPIAIDNAALYSLFSESASEISHLEEKANELTKIAASEISRLEEKVNELTKIVNRISPKYSVRVIVYINDEEEAFEGKEFYNTPAEAFSDAESFLNSGVFVNGVHVNSINVKAVEVVRFI